MNVLCVCVYNENIIYIYIYITYIYIYNIYIEGERDILIYSCDHEAVNQQSCVARFVADAYRL